MKVLRLCSVSSLCALCPLAGAFPLLHIENFLQRREPQSYSVVAVDGGQPTNSPVATVTDQIIQTQFQTVLSTIVITESQTAKTIVITSTAAVTVTAPVTVSAPAETKTLVVEPSVTSSPYDDGMWKTTYYTHWTVTSSSAAATSLLPLGASSEISTSSVTGFPAIPTSTSTATAAAVTDGSKPGVSTITTSPVAPMPTTITTSFIASSLPESTTSSIDWATAYGQWRDKPKNGSWWW